jgi:hypothetical protein
MAALYQVDAEARRERKRTPAVAKKVESRTSKEGRVEVHREVITTPEEVEAREFVASLARNFAASVQFYKAEPGGSLSHAEAVAAVEAGGEHRLGTLDGKDLKEVSWSDLSAVARADMGEVLALWGRIRDAADDALMCGTRAAAVAGATSPYERAEFLAIRDAFADEWKPRGGIESAMIDQLTIAFSLQMYWAAIAHERATRAADEMREERRRYESMGWKLPRQSEADATEQAHRLADGYNRQFLRVLRQLRDLRRYAPPVIVNNGGQVNVANQQVNVT